MDVLKLGRSRNTDHRRVQNKHAPVERLHRIDPRLDDVLVHVEIAVDQIVASVTERARRRRESESLVFHISRFVKPLDAFGFGDLVFDVELIKIAPVAIRVESRVAQDGLPVVLRVIAPEPSRTLVRVDARAAHEANEDAVGAHRLKGDEHHEEDEVRILPVPLDGAVDADAVREDIMRGHLMERVWGEYAVVGDREMGVRSLFRRLRVLLLGGVGLSDRHAVAVAVARFGRGAALVVEPDERV
mmetsp:Transcript_34649/g.107143  ORF Transcript_34649/g.107143 Transcript_34649/m.107143 type:complete len:244 (-) Transcript_34649:246-977(-)